MSKKMQSLCSIMAAAHALAETAWPRRPDGSSDMPIEGQDRLIDVQIAAAAALGLPDDLPLMTGDPDIDL